MATATETASAPLPVQRPQRSLWSDAWRRLLGSSAGRVGLLISGVLVLLALTINLIDPYNPARDRNLRLRLQPPSMLMDPATRERFEVGYLQVPFGTDELGRNLWTRVLHGAP